MNFLVYSDILQDSLLFMISFRKYTCLKYIMISLMSARRQNKYIVLLLYLQFFVNFYLLRQT